MTGPLRGIHASIGFALLGVLYLPAIRLGLETRLLTHMLVQLPLLVLAGWLIGTALMAVPEKMENTDWNRGGIPGFIVAVVTLLFWMLPKSLDGALDDVALEAVKFVTLPLCLGLPLAVSWPRAHLLVRGFLKAQFVSMLGVLAFLYATAPVRICNNYLVSEQETLGLLLVGIAASLALVWGGSLFFAAEPNAGRGAAARA